MQFPKPPSVEYQIVVRSWIAPFAFAALGFGWFLVYINSSAGVTWKSPAIFVGVLCGILAITAALSGTVAYYLSRMLTRGRGWSPALHAAIAAAVAFSYVGYQITREYSLDAQWRWINGITLGSLGVILAGAFMRGAAHRWISNITIAVNVIFIGMLAAALYTFHGPGFVDVADARSAVPKFEPGADRPARAAVNGRVFVLGVDGATMDLIQPLVAASRLPNFEKLIREGASTRLRTMKPTVSPAIWTTIVTGKTPLRHGVQDFFIRNARFLSGFNLQMENRALRAVFSWLDLYHVLPVTSNVRTTKAIWNIASEMQVSSGVVGWWATYPAESVKGAIISDAASAEWIQRHVGRNEQLILQKSAMVYPESLLLGIKQFARLPQSVSQAELKRFLEVDQELWDEFNNQETLDRDKPLSLFHRTYLSDEFFVNSAMHIDRTMQPELLMCYVRMIDGLGHFCWNLTEPECVDLGVPQETHETYKDIINNGYEWIDGFIGRFLRHMKPEDTLIVISDHGWERVSKGVYHHANAPDGIFIAYGPDIKKNFTPAESPHVLDVCPTLLHLMGLPKGADMPGRVLAEMFLQSREVRTISSWDAGRGLERGASAPPDAQGTMRELEQFGYLRGKK